MHPLQGEGGAGAESVTSLSLPLASSWPEPLKVPSRLQQPFQQLVPLQVPWQLALQVPWQLALLVPWQQALQQLVPLLVPWQQALQVPWQLVL